MLRPASCCAQQEFLAAAKAADVAVLVLGDGDRDCGEWHDRDNLDLAGGQLSLLQAIAGVAPKTIVVLVHGRPQTFGLGNAVLAKVDALIAAWRPGEEVREWFFSLRKMCKRWKLLAIVARGDASLVSPLRFLPSRPIWPLYPVRVAHGS